jgi:hypothetical protein
MKIEGSANICNVFSIFHDGGIVHCHEENGSLLLEIEIQYLAERISPAFRKFVVLLEHVKDVCFSTWPSDLKSEPEVLKDITSIFHPELEILEGNLREGKIQVVCNQHSPEFDYCGGELYFSAASAEVIDEGGKSYSLDELDALCKGYWDEWESRNKPSNI